MEAALAELYPLNMPLRKTYDAAMSVMTDGVGDMSDAGKRAKWAALQAQAKPGQAMRKLILAATGVMVGSPRKLGDAMDLDTAVLTVRVRHMLTADHPDTERVLLALRIIRRFTHLPGADLQTILECDDGDVRVRMTAASRLLFSWEMQWDVDNVRRVVAPWIAGVCKTAMRILDDLL
jgi:hypothetical protein